MTQKRLRGGTRIASIPTPARGHDATDAQRPRFSFSVGERHASWLELFFDLVFVLAIAELAHYLHDHLTLAGFGGFVFLFIPVWWVWSGFSYHGDLFTIDSLAYRATMLTAMLLSTALAINLYHALDGGSARFALAYVALRIVLVGLYAWSWWQVREARPLSSRYVIGFSLGAAIWASSLAVPEPQRYWLWIVGMLVEVVTPIFAQKEVFRAAPIQQSHLPERFGLFTLVVLGESITVTGAGVASTDWDSASVLVALCSFAVVGCLWWLYFDHVDEQAFERASTGGRSAFFKGFVWAYGHLAIYVGLAATAVGIERAIGESAEPMLLVSTRAALGGGVALYILTLIILQACTPVTLAPRLLVTRLMVVIAALVLALLGNLLTPVVFVGILALSVVALLAFEIIRASHTAYASTE